MNTIKTNNRLSLYESCWRKSKNNITTDSSGLTFPYPTERINTDGYKWKGGRQQFINKLLNVQTFANKKDIKKKKECLLCCEKFIINTEYSISNIKWNSELEHYIVKHQVKPTKQFIDMIYRSEEPKNTKRQILRTDSTTYTRNGLSYVKLDKIHINIFDALMEHGGGNKKYKDKKNPDIVRNSEHAGLIDYNENGLDKIIISGKTDHVDKNDNEIYMPKNIPEAYDYEYIFHTHPPTPTPGGRVEYGILYEFPSISDIFHFIDHFNDGNTQGSIVMAPEGLYCIRKLIFDLDEIHIDENKMFRQLKSLYRNVQKKSIKKYGTVFDDEKFYSTIAQDKSYIKTVNDCLNNFGLHIDYYSRTYDKINDIWFVDSIYLPIFITEPVKNTKK